MTGYPARTIAIVGMSGRFPGAHCIEEYWANLEAAVESISALSEADLLAAGVSEAVMAEPTYVRFRGLVPDHEMFDAAFFGCSRREAELMDPQQRLVLQQSYEALNNAGYARGHLPGTVGVYFGTAQSTHPAYRALFTVAPGTDTDPRILLGNEEDHMAARVAYKLDLRGPALSVRTACSSSLVAVHLACQALLLGDCDMALAGGVAVRAIQPKGYVYQPGGINSPDGHCRSFDKRAEGSVGGGGVGVVVLRRLADALRDRDNIVALLRGTAANNDGAERVGYTAPSATGQAEVIARALAVAEVAPESVTYIEAHGTGTPVGDPIEVAALRRVYGKRSPGAPGCAIGSVKTNIGHLDAASGIAGLIKTALALQHGIIPASLHFTEVNPLIELSGCSLYINAETVPWDAHVMPRRAAVSSFGIGGTNVHAILEQAPKAQPVPYSGAVEVLPVSARTAPAADRAMTQLLKHLDDNPDLSLSDAAYTLAVGRERFDHRRAVVRSTTPGPVTTGKVLSGTVPESRNRIMFVFDCETSVPTAAVSRYYSLEVAFRSAVDRCEDALRSVCGVVLGEPADTSAWTFTFHYALAELLKSWGVAPDAASGRGTGELLAAHFAGVLSLEDALRLATGFGDPADPAGSQLLPIPAAPSAADEQRIIIDVSSSFTPSSLAVQVAGDSARCLCTGCDETALAHLLGELWVCGVAVALPAIRATSARYRVPLPAYPFETTSFPVDARRQETSRDDRRLRKQADVADWFWVPAWRETAPLAPRESDGRLGHVLVFAEPGVLATEVIRALRRIGHQVTAVHPADTFAQPSQDTFDIRPGIVADYKRLLSSVGYGLRGTCAILHAWNLQGEMGDVADPRMLAAARRRGTHSLICLGRALAETAKSSPTRICAATTGVYDVTGHEDLQPEHAEAVGPCRVIPQELAHVRCRIVDIEPPGRRLVAVEDLAAQLVSELESDHDEPNVAYRGTRRWTQSVAKLPAAPCPDPGLVLRRGGVYMITGGLGRIGLRIAEHLAEVCSARLVLIGRTAIPREDWAAWLDAHGTDDRTSRMIRRLQEIEQCGGQVLALPASVGDEVALTSAIDQARREFGPINGVIHAAGAVDRSSMGYIHELSVSDGGPLFSSKVWGTIVVDRVCGTQPLDFVILLSSVSVVLGGVGLSAYAGSNAFMDTYARKRSRDKQSRWLSVNWDSWLDESAAGKTLYGDRSQVAIIPEEGIAAVERLWSMTSLGQVIVSTTDLNERIERWVRHIGNGATHKVPVSNPGARSPQWLEHEITQIWRDLLGSDHISPDDSFFAMGGDSLLALQLIRNLQRIFGVVLPASALFTAPTVAALTRELLGRLAQDSDAKRVNELALQIDQLSDSEVEETLARLSAAAQPDNPE